MYFSVANILAIIRRFALLATGCPVGLTASRRARAGLFRDRVDSIRRRSVRVWRGAVQRVTLACSIALFCFPTFGVAQSGSGTGGTVDRVAIELLNPVTSLRSVAFDFEGQTYQGSMPTANEQEMVRMVIRPSWPIELGNGKNLLLRAGLPIIDRKPSWTPDDKRVDWAEFLLRQIPELDEENGAFGDGHAHFGDASFDIGYGDTDSNGNITMFGVSMVAPTSDDESVSRNQFLLGPEIAFGRVTGWGIYGLRANHLTNIYGEGIQGVEYDTNETRLKLFFGYSLGNGWLIESNPEILYDWEGIDDNQWNVPVGAGISKTSMFGQVPIKFAVELQHFVVSTDRLAPEWLLRFSIVPVIPRG